MSDFPADSIQAMVDHWWVEDPEKTICRGSLVWTHVQFFSQVPYQLIVERAEERQHDRALVHAEPLHANARKTGNESLPVAGFPRLDGADCYITNRAKKRPCLILGAVNRKALEKKWAQSMGAALKHDFFLVAPYFSVEQQGRAGCPPAFVERIMHAEYSRYFWDFLPGHHGHESILRLDQVQPVGYHHQAYEPYGYRLSPAALKLLDEWFDWMLFGRVGEDLPLFRELIKSE